MAGGNLINYPGKLSTQTATLTTSKLMWNSVLSTEWAKYMCLDIKKIPHRPPGPFQIYENANYNVSGMDH